MSKVLVAGSTGVIGRKVVESLIQRGHSVIALIRSQNNSSDRRLKVEQKLSKLGATLEYIDDILDFGAIAKAAGNSQIFMYDFPTLVLTVSNTINPLPLEFFRKPKSEVDVLKSKIARTQGVVSLCKAAKMVGAKAFLHQSIVWTVRPSDGRSFDETSQAVDTRLNDYIEGEQAVLKFSTLSMAILRLGLRKVDILSLASSILQGKVPIVGGGENLVSLVHVDDVASAFVTAAEQLAQDAKKSGIYHVTDDEPISMAELLTSIAEDMGASAPYSVPEWMARMATSGEIIDFLTSSTVTSSVKFKQTFGWKPKYPNLKQGLAQVIDEWNKSKLDLHLLD